MNSLQIQNNAFIEEGLKDCIASINKNIKNVNLLEKSDKPEIIKNIETNIMKELECFVSLFNAVSNLRDTMESATIPSSLYNDLVNVKGKLSDLRQSAKKCLSKNVIDFHYYILARVMQALETPSDSEVNSTKDGNGIKNLPYVIFSSVAGGGGFINPINPTINFQFIFQSILQYISIYIQSLLNQ